ncbi:hypothetical protein C1646_722928 [Rhizophagus diaphanus]|nr:hypothetical protein C1646_722928 [Rhizophagus diaphanus] [Rhizophagus sp. MUCL 43196]
MVFITMLYPLLILYVTEIFCGANSFIMFRIHLLWALKTNVSNTSKLAKYSWGTASKEFKEFYREYTKNVFN